MIYSHDGLTLFSKTFSKEISSHNINLLAGAFSAVSSLIKDSTKSTGNVETIILEEKILKIINRDSFICTLLVEYSIQASEEAHKNFALDFENRFYQDLPNFEGEVSIFKKADNLVSKYFT